ncbi:Alanine racemase, biosynthetic [Alphaproteobacteria bacterium SO-S41]|nr:Alanine racemase, biosynthetic [Alphaproteobacteria bacterium SO-S41]
MSVPAAESLTAPVRDRPVLTVSLAAIGMNWRTLKDAAPTAEMAAVVKADGYGLGAVPATAKLRAMGCETFFVATHDEASAIRTAAGQSRIFVLNGFPPGGAASFAADGLIPVLNSLDEARDWAALGGRRACALHIDTGLNRAGLSTPELDALTADPALLARLDLALVMSHLACSDDAGHPQNAHQLARFKAALTRLPAAPASLASSAGVFLGADYHFDLIRPGIALYGGHPLAHGPNPMRAAAVLTADVLGVRTIQPGEPAGYGATFTATRETRLAVCNIGYADGIPRALSNRGVAFIGDTPCPYAGRVSMDLLTIDVSNLPASEVGRGTEVEIIGPHMTVEDMATRAGTANYEILTGLGSRFTRLTTDSHWTRIV